MKGYISYPEPGGESRSRIVRNRFNPADGATIEWLEDTRTPRRNVSNRHLITEGAHAGLIAVIASLAIAEAHSAKAQEALTPAKSFSPSATML